MSERRLIGVSEKDVEDCAIAAAFEDGITEEEAEALLTAASSDEWWLTDNEHKTSRRAADKLRTLFSPDAEGGTVPASRTYVCPICRGWHVCPSDQQQREEDA